MDASDWIAIYGAGLSSFLAIRQWKLSRRHLKISSCPAFNGPDYTPAGTFTRVTLANHGSQPVFVRSVHLSVHLRRYAWHETLTHFYRFWRLRQGVWIGSALPANTIVEPPLPTEILPGRSMTVWLPADELMDTSKGRRTRLLVQDEMDRQLVSPDIALHLAV